MKYGYIPIVIKKDKRIKNYDALESAHTTKDYHLFINLITNLLEESAKLWLRVI